MASVGLVLAALQNGLADVDMDSCRDFTATAAAGRQVICVSDCLGSA